MRKLLLAAAMAAAFCATANARLGETSAQLEARWGKPDDSMAFAAPFKVGEEYELRAYEKNDFWCFAYFTHDRCVCAALMQSKGAALPESSIQSLLYADSAGLTWQELHADKIRSWQRADKGADAVYPFVSPKSERSYFLMISYEFRTYIERVGKPKPSGDTTGF